LTSSQHTRKPDGNSRSKHTKARTPVVTPSVTTQSSIQSLSRATTQVSSHINAKLCSSRCISQLPTQPLSPHPKKRLGRRSRRFHNLSQYREQLIQDMPSMCKWNATYLQVVSARPHHEHPSRSTPNAPWHKTHKNWGGPFKLHRAQVQLICQAPYPPYQWWKTELSLHSTAATTPHPL
jgi:hypothetical protein